MKPQGINLSKRELGLLLFNMAVVLVLYLRFGYFAQSKSRQELSQTVDELQIKVNFSKQLIAQVESLSQQKELEGAKNLLASNIGEEKTIPELMKEITRQAERHNVGIKKISLMDYKKNPVLSEYFFNLEVESAFLNIGAFLESLEEYKMVVDVRSVKIDRFENDLIKCHGNIVIYGVLEQKEE